MSDTVDLELRPSPTGDGLLHASCVAFDGKGVLIIGASGSGKSALALELMAYGCTLVSDDQVILGASNAGITAQAPDTLKGAIEARGVGILHADSLEKVDVHLCVSLDQAETHRLPPEHTITCLGARLPLLFGVPHPHFASAVLQYLKKGRRA